MKCFGGRFEYFPSAPLSCIILLHQTNTVSNIRMKHFSYQVFSDLKQNFVPTLTFFAVKLPPIAAANALASRGLSYKWQPYPWMIFAIVVEN